MAQWFWQSDLRKTKAAETDESAWTPYTQADNDKLEHAFGKSKTLSLNETYKIDFTVMEQQRKDDKSRRRFIMRKELVAQWFWQSDLRKSKAAESDKSAWTAYEKEDNDKLEKAYNKKQKTLSLNETYKIDFTCMEQQRKDDKSRRRFIMRKQEGPISGAAVGAESAGTKRPAEALESRKTKAAAAGGTRGPTGAAKSLMVEPAKLHTLQMKVDGDEGGSDDEEDDDPYMKEYHLIGHGGKVVPGDLCWFPDMMTGGGDFEGVFFAAPPTAKEPHDSVRLLSTDCECMDFPQEIVDLVGGADKLEAHFSAAMEEADQDWLEFDDIFTNVRDPDGEGPPPVMIEGGSLPRVAVVYQPVPKDDAK